LTRTPSFETIQCNNSKERKSMKQKVLQMMFAVLVCAGAQAQVNTGSNGSDGAFNPTTNIVISMADHPTGIYQYTSVNISNGVTVTFIPNANNTPVYWIVQNSVTISGSVNVSGQSVVGSQAQGGLGGPGGYRGGDGGNGSSSQPTSGQGPGGGMAGNSGSYTYGNIFLIPLLGGSGGSGGNWNSYNGTSGQGGGGGGGAILIAASNVITISGSINAGAGVEGTWGSGGAVRLVASQIYGNGSISAYGPNSGRVRFDTYDNEFSGNVNGQFTSGFQPIIIPSSGQLPQLTVTSVGGVPVSASPTGVLSTPDAVLSAQQNNPIPIVVSCANLPLNTQITVSVTPANGSPVSATGYNTTGTQSSSTATISIVIPRGGGLIYATAATSN
jgi:hypothetical protein